MKVQNSSNSIVYVVDDDEVFAATISAYLRNRGLIAREFYNVNDCMQALKNERPSLIISDYDFSLNDEELSTNGFRFYSWVKKVYGNIPFIVFSGQQDGALVLSMVREGIRHYIMKDKSMFAELEESLKEILS